jgi:hypothetical protein
MVQFFVTTKTFIFTHMASLIAAIQKMKVKFEVTKDILMQVWIQEEKW